MASIICGNCGLKHESVTEVRSCYDMAESPLATNAVTEESQYNDDALKLGEVADFSPAVIAQNSLEQRPDTMQGGSPDTLSGYYHMNGDIYRVVKSQSGDRHYAQRLYKVKAEDGDKPAKPVWVYARGAVYDIKNEDRLTPEQAKEFGDLYGICLMCGRLLTNPESIERGVGPVCAEKQWGYK